MKAVRIHETGDVRVLRIEEVPVPTPGQGQALVRLRAAGVNFLDIYHRTGRTPHLHHRAPPPPPPPPPLPDRRGWPPLVPAPAGGVGALLVQMAKRRGA